jgi:hypothetical protein
VEWFALKGVIVHGREVSVVWDHTVGPQAESS